MKEPEIKLFGRKIQLPENTGEVPGGECSDVISDQDHVIPAEEDNQKPNETEESQKPNTPSREESGENPKTPSIVEEDNPKSETEQSNSPNEQQKTLKKPNKILPCPRCSSMDTKFCYYNNYNINQPRHFCKGCQRYWTAGGTMRNVPVGSGRRKNKNSSSHSNHITINEAALQASRIVDAAHNGFHHQSFTPNGTVLSFGPDSQLCESMSSGSTPEKRAVKNGFYTVDQIGLTSCKKEGKKDNCSVGSSNGFPSHVPYVPWTFPWNAYPVPTFYHPQPYWNYAWNVPWLPIPNQNSPPNSSSSLGKHSRNGELLKPNDLGHKEKEEKKSLESSIVVPKTLRIDDPDEAAKSSIWETLGIKYDSAQREGLFKALQHKCDEKKSIVSNSSVLHANPAALSRSITFQEGV